jgi:hypothetical protein
MVVRALVGVAMLDSDPNRAFERHVVLHVKPVAIAAGAVPARCPSAAAASQAREIPQAAPEVFVTTHVVPFPVVESLRGSVQPWNPRHREISAAARLDSSPISGRVSGGRRKAGPDTLTAPTTAPSTPRIGAPIAFNPGSSSSTV